MPGRLEYSVGTGHYAPECLPYLLLLNPALPDTLLVEAWHVMEFLSAFKKKEAWLQSELKCP